MPETTIFLPLNSSACCARVLPSTGVYCFLISASVGVAVAAIVGDGIGVGRRGVKARRVAMAPPPAVAVVGVVFTELAATALGDGSMRAAETSTAIQPIAKAPSTPTRMISLSQDRSVTTPHGPGGQLRSSSSKHSSAFIIRYKNRTS